MMNSIKNIVNYGMKKDLDLESSSVQLQVQRHKFDQVWVEKILWRNQALAKTSKNQARLCGFRRGVEPQNMQWKLLDENKDFDVDVDGLKTLPK
jgi:hypothetical protein